MTDNDDEDRTEPFDDGQAAQHVAHLTGMSLEAATAFAAYHSGRFAQGSGFKDGA